MADIEFMDVLGLRPRTKRSLLAFGGSGAGASNPAALVELNTRLPVLLSVKTTRWRLRVANWASSPFAYSRTGAFLPGVVAFNGAWVGPAVLGNDGEPTGVTTSMTQALAAFSTNADGSDYLTNWVTDPTAQFQPHKMSMLSYGWVPGSVTNMGSSNCRYWYRYGAGALGGASQTNPAAYGSSGGAGTGQWMDVRLEYEFEGANSVGLIIGDSLSEAQFSPTGGSIYSTWHQQAALSTDTAIACTARGGQDTTTFSDGTAWEWARLGTELTPDWVGVYLPTNDFNQAVGSDSAANRLAAIQGRMATILGLAKSKFSVDRKFLFTIPPANYTSTTEAARVLFNSWAKTGPYGVDGVFDFDKLMRDPTNAAVMFADYNGTDNIHHSRAAHQAEAAVAAAILPRLARAA